MVTVHRAVFTSIENGRTRGYQLAAAGDGISREAREELSRWCPAHNALLAGEPAAPSVNFHRVAAGLLCVSRTFRDGDEYSGRGGGRTTTVLLLVEAAELARFHCNPFRLLEAACAGGHLHFSKELPDKLPPATLAPAAKPVDALLLTRLLDSLGAERLATLIAAATSPLGVDLVGAAGHKRIIAALVNLLPASCRAELSFTTGLRPSQQRPFHVQSLLERPLGRSDRATFEIDGPASREARFVGWAGRVYEFLARRDLRGLASLVAKAPPDATLESLA